MTKHNSAAPGLPDDFFEHDGLITKRHVRAGALAFLRPASGELLWDIGLGSGSIAIEWCLLADNATAIGVEKRPDRAERAIRNIENLTPGRVRVEFGPADQVIDRLPAPDAIFVGGGASEKVLSHGWNVLKPGGRMVIHGVTIETDTLCLAAYRKYGGSLSRISIETVEPIGKLLGWKPARAVTQWAAVKP